VGHPEVLAITDAPNWAQTRFGLTENELELRVLRGALRCEHVGVSYLRYAPSWRLTVGHRHPGGGEEVYVLVEGSARIKIEDQILHMQAPSAVRVHGDQFRAIRAEGDTAAVFVAAGTIDDPDVTEFARNFWPEDE
jgi:hypothetical protein